MGVVAQSTWLTQGRGSPHPGAAFLNTVAAEPSSPVESACLGESGQRPTRALLRDSQVEHLYEYRYSSP